MGQAKAQNVSQNVVRLSFTSVVLLTDPFASQPEATRKLPSGRLVFFEYSIPTFSLLLAGITLTAAQKFSLQ